MIAPVVTERDAARSNDGPDAASLAAIRQLFPALDRTWNGRPVAYFDGPGGTQVPRPVADAMIDYLFHHNANTHWQYPTSEETDAIIENSRTVFADFLNASADEIVFGANMTTLTFHLARALGRSYRPGDEIIVTELDHHANVAPWQALERETGIRTRMVKMIRESGEIDWDDFDAQLNSRTKLVAIGAASNALGTITDVRRASELARGLGARTFVDAVHYAPHEPADVQDLGCDFLACSAYKFYGPHLGILFGRRDLLGSLEFPKLLPAPNTAPERAETGTLNHEGIAGAAAAVEFLSSLGNGSSRRSRLIDAFARLRSRSGALVEQLWDGLSRIPRVRMYGPPATARRTPTVAFTIERRPASSVARYLAEQAIFASSGDFYAATVAERLQPGSDGFVRAGCACYTTSDEVERFVDAIRMYAAAH